MDGQLSLSELNSLVKDALQVAFPEQLWVVAEIGELKVNRTGHCYIELVEKNSATDEISARARATIWSWQFRFIQPYFETTTGQALTAGLKVLVSVSVEFHEVFGYSLNIKDIDPNYTLGDMARRRAEIIRKLEDEGIIDMNKEIPLPEIPSRIAVISSPTAAGYEDFMTQLANNEAGYKFYTRLFPSAMQGTDAPKSIIAALNSIFDVETMFDVVVIIRGGGSQMDLNCFDDYDLAVNISQFPLPVLTGIGHEKDESIADLVANTKLKTPTAVAEFLINKYDEVASEIDTLESAFFDQVNYLLEGEMDRLNNNIRFLRPLVNAKLEKTSMILGHFAKSVKPTVSKVIEQQNFQLVQMADLLLSTSNWFMKEKRNKLTTFSSELIFRSKLRNQKEKQAIGDIERKLSQVAIRYMEKQQNKLSLLQKSKELVDPVTILKRGFSITLRNGKALKSTEGLKDGEQLETILYNGKIISTVKKS